MADPLSTDAEEFLSWLAVEKGRARNTVISYRRDLRQWEAWAAEHGVDPRQCGSGDITRYLDSRRAVGAGPASSARAISTLRGLYGFLVDEGRLGEDPTSHVRSPQLVNRLPKALDEDQVLALLEAAGGDDPVARRDRALLEVLYGTGARISEVVGLSLLDVETDDGLLRVFGKGSRERLVPLGGMGRFAIGRWLSPLGRPLLEPDRWRSRNDAEALFLNQRGGRLSRQGAWSILKHRAARVGLEPLVSPHVLRHSCATHMLEHGADIRIVQELLGHVSVTTTQIYTRLSTGHLRTVYDRSHPRAIGQQAG